MGERNSKTTDFYFFVAQSLISYSITFPILIVNAFTIANKSRSLSCDTVVVCVVGISLDFKNFTINLRSIMLTIIASLLTHSLPSTFNVLNTFLYFLTVMLSTNLLYSQSIRGGKS